jgi:hypothetical protein
LAKLNKVIKFSGKKDGVYSGAYLFKKNTISIIDPIYSNEMKGIWTDFKGLGQQKSVLSLTGFRTFYNLLVKKNMKCIDDIYLNVLMEENKSLERIGFGEDDEVFPEGKFILKKHLMRERSPAVIKKAKSNFEKKHGRLFCEVCSFDFETIYGTIGEGFIEGHHLIPVSEMQEGDETKPSDILLVCSNCHKMIHRKRPWLEREELLELLSAKVKK